MAADPGLRDLMRTLYTEGLINGARALEAYEPEPETVEGVTPALNTGQPHYIDNFRSTAHTIAKDVYIPPLGHTIQAWRCSRCGGLFHPDHGYPPQHKCFGRPLENP